MIPIPITIPAATAAGNGTIKYSARGKYFLLKATNGEFLVQTDYGQTFDFSQPGEGFGNDSSPMFKRLNFSNPGGTAVTLTFYASMTPIRTPDASVNNNITASASLTNTLAICAFEAESQIQVNPAGGAPTAFAAAGTYFRRATIVAQSSLGRAANVGNVFIGVSNVNQPIALPPGGFWTIEADTGGKRDLGSWYVSAANAGDGISILYI